MADKIDLSTLCKNDEDFLDRYNKLSKDIKEYAKFEGHLYDSGEKLYTFLEFDTKISQELERLFIYAHINNDLDLSKTRYQEFYGKMMRLFEQIEEITSFVVPELLEKDYDYFEKMANEYPKLKEYALVIKRILRAKKYTKSKEEEKLISLLTTTYSRPEEISEMLINTDLKYGTIKDENDEELEVTNANYGNLYESSNGRVRKDTFFAVHNAFKDHCHTCGTILATEVINNNRLAKLRNFKSAREYALYRNEVDNSIYDKLIEGVNKNLPKYHKYLEFKKDVLGIKDFHTYDTSASITKKYNKKYEYENAKEIVLSALGVLGKDYTDTLKLAYKENWIDSGICKTKRSGGYSTAAYVTHPYVFISYDNKLNDVSTLAHELGHALHSHYAIKNNKYQDYEYTIFVAEVASQVNEILLTDYLYKNSNDIEEKKYLLDQIIQRFKGTIITQTMFAEYEDKIHTLEANGEVLTPEILENEYLKVSKAYNGPAVNVDEEIKYSCYRIPHFYYDFYVYQYATGYAAALKIASSILNGEKDAVEKYLEFLKLGSTKDPVESLKVAGVDIKNEKIYDEVFEIFEEKLKMLRSLYE